MTGHRLIYPACRCTSCRQPGGLCAAPGFNAWYAAVWLRLPGQERRVLDAHFSPMVLMTMTDCGRKANRRSAATSAAGVFHLPREVYVRGAERAEQVAWPEGITGFEIDVVLNETGLTTCRLTAIISVCTACRSQPVSAGSRSVTPFATGKRILLRPMRIQDGHTEIYSVDNIFLRAIPAVRRMSPSPAFVTGRDAAPRCAGTLLPHAGKARPSGLHDTWLILGGDAFDTDRCWRMKPCP